MINSREPTIIDEDEEIDEFEESNGEEEISSERSNNNKKEQYKACMFDQEVRQFVKDQNLLNQQILDLIDQSISNSYIEMQMEYQDLF